MDITTKTKQFRNAINNLDGINQLDARVQVNTIYAVVDNWINVIKGDIKHYEHIGANDLIIAKIRRLQSDLEQCSNVLYLMESKGWKRVLRQ